jgi:sulfoxide reductase heme-binding subunit YedZ
VGAACAGRAAGRGRDGRIVTTPSPLWFATRGAGAVTLLLLTAVVLLGIATTTRQQGGRWPKFLSARVHRNLSLAAITFLALHITTAILDPFAHLQWRDAVVPFGSAYRPFWLGLGVVAAEAVGALAITSAVRSRLGYKSWRVVHWIAYACWPLAVLHGLGTGSDVRAGWFQLIAMACVIAVFVTLVVWRLGHAWPNAAGFKTVTAVGSGFAVVALALWMANGPLAPGWAHAAGTPIELLPNHTQPASGARLPTGGG